MQAPDCDVVIIGAGIAGLTALSDLASQGIRVLCVEARDRIGGRILTVHDPYSPLPIELGPEFIHGRPKETWDVVRNAKLAVFDCDENAVHVKNGKISDRSDAWEQVDYITGEMRRLARSGADPSFSEFIKSIPSSERAKELATSYVEGFNAAHAEKISVASLAQDAAAADEIGGDRNFRIVNGYRSITDSILAEVDHADDRLLLNSIVRAVHWKTGEAAVQICSSLTGAVTSLQTRRVIITVPLGVLTADRGETGAIDFEPTTKQFAEGLDTLEFGHVIRLVFRFKRAWWEENPHFGDSGFWLSQEQFFPTWWTTLPMRAPLLTGWSAGPHSDALLGKPMSFVVSKALEDLGRITHLGPAFLENEIAAVHFHDWHADPFARGAYSYVKAGNFSKRAQLTIPVENTLFFAGEATELDGHGATVHGARATGHRAALQVLDSLNGRRVLG